MNGFWRGLVSVSALAMSAAASAADRHSTPTCVLSLTQAGHVHEIIIRIAVGDMPYRDAWMRSIDAIFEFADVDANGAIDEAEGRLIPSARGLRLGLGTGFVPPVDTVRSVRRDILGGVDAVCDRNVLRRYYVRYGVACLPIGHAVLPHTRAITDALARAIDADGDGRLSEQEFSKAERIAERLDGNDDELVGVGELVEGMTYPGRAADQPLLPMSDLALPASQGGPLTLRRLAEGSVGVGSSTETAGPGNRSMTTEIDVTAAACRWFTTEPGVFPGDAWCARGRLPEQLARFAAVVVGSEAEDMARATVERDRAVDKSWLIPAADRDADGSVSRDEMSAWVALQQRIMAGHMLVSLYSGGGLFEVLDRNHDAALSVREFREAWLGLVAAGYAKDGHVDPASVPNQILVVVSHGYPLRLQKDSDAYVAWFGHMDRNGDGDVSRREFTGTRAVFQKMDQDDDGLISPAEAAKHP